jgi:hypothetical protein
VYKFPVRNCSRMFREKQRIAEGLTSGRSPVGRKTRRVAGVTIQFQVGPAGFEPRATANHAAKPHANRALGSQRRAGEATRTERLKTGASELKSASHTCNAPSFSPYRSNGLHRADTPTRFRTLLATPHTTRPESLPRTAKGVGASGRDCRLAI